ncbi:uncharacterized protein LOC122811049 [Protopterus annectens]|uniref:uncharacterized protein LOC122811049 n=1 Tax=Protopterus annectens TaxID=7888 RepID=UPI001CFA5CA7|nr:uncharacterized protein LOC122811049 [Protopterus annectens]
MFFSLRFLVLLAGLLVITAEENKWTSEKCTEKKSLYDTLWDDNSNIAQEALNTNFLVLMAGGSLAAERYMNFTLQDIYYAVKVTELLNIQAKKSDPRKDVREFFNGRNASYTRFANDLLTEFHFKVFPTLEPSPAMKKYISSFDALLKEDPLYFVVGLLPCSKLWPYLAQNMNIKESSPYINFKNNNKDDRSRKHFEQVLENHRKEMNESKANYIFKSHMENERDFFAES